MGAGRRLPRLAPQRRSEALRRKVVLRKVVLRKVVLRKVVLRKADAVRLLRPVAAPAAPA